ncbi:unnamed protein product [Cuscuta epithymum]|uniref:Uncharacterized protein n=1 Tax=Cuscuta epithymum TaxID=186058 RepID=A0AAV0DP15_9ASTE|nr:unnamed protein product [Cuscuta epithymum]
MLEVPEEGGGDGFQVPVRVCLLRVPQTPRGARLFLRFQGPGPACSCHGQSCGQARENLEVLMDPDPLQLLPGDGRRETGDSAGLPMNRFDFSIPYLFSPN